jgi:hypothetical protein
MARANILHSEIRQSSQDRMAWPLQLSSARHRTATVYKIDTSKWAIGDGRGSQFAHPAVLAVWGRPARILIALGGASLCWMVLAAPLWALLQHG